MPRSVRLDTKQPTGSHQVTVSFDEAIERIKKKAQNPDCLPFTFYKVDDPRFEFFLFVIFGNRYILVTDIPENTNSVLEEFMLAWNDQVAKKTTEWAKKNTVGNHFVASDTIPFLTELFNRLRSVYGTFPNEDRHSAEECQKCDVVGCAKREAPNIFGQQSKQLIAEFKDLLETVFAITENRNQPFSMGTLPRLGSLFAEIEVKLKMIIDAMGAEGMDPIMIPGYIAVIINRARWGSQQKIQGKQENKEPEVLIQISESTVARALNALQEQVNQLNELKHQLEYVKRELKKRK
jgi:hypothetical protein